MTPQSVLQGDRTVAAVICLSFALLAGFVGWLTYALGFGVEGGLVRGLVTGLRLGPVAALLGGLAGGLTVGLGNTAWGWFVVARAWLAARRKLPLRLMGFLEDAYRRQVLRQAGATWQFRHARLRQHLAAPPGTGSDRPSRG